MAGENKKRKRENKKRAIVESLANGVSRAGACRAASVGRRTFYHWLKGDARFRKQVEDAQGTAIETVESVAFACALKAEHDPRYQTALIFWLKANAGWKETVVQEHVETDGSEFREAIAGRIRELVTGRNAGNGTG